MTYLYQINHCKRVVSIIMDEDEFDSMSDIASISTGSSSYQQFDCGEDWYDHYDSDPYDSCHDWDNEITSDIENEDAKQDTVNALMFRYSLFPSLVILTHNSHSDKCI